MSMINILDKITVDQIAAGEVVERPSSVVKELVENALDSGATAITVEIRGGGSELIRVSDNGCGIERSEIKKAFMRHATSKLINISDLFSLTTLGFRGEALSSIAAIAQVEMITKTVESLTGCRYVIEGGEEKSLEEIGAPTGTTIIVRNLFYNTPARKKFLKSDRTEASAIADLMEHLALDNPSVSFSFINNKDDRFHTSGNGDLKELIYRIYGRDVSLALVPVKCETDGVSMEGYVGEPSINRSNRNCEIFFVNGRYIRDKLLSKAVEEGCREYLMQHKFPFCVLHFVMEPDLIDVNVHPSKMEIKFQNQQTLFEFVRQNIQQILRNKEMIPEALRNEKEDLAAAAMRQKRLDAYALHEQIGSTGMTGIFHGNFDTKGNQIGAALFLNESHDDPASHAHQPSEHIPSPDNTKKEEFFFDDSTKDEPSRYKDQDPKADKERTIEPFEAKRLEEKKDKSAAEAIVLNNVATSPVRIADNDKNPIWARHGEDNPERIKANEKLVTKILGETAAKPASYESPVIKKDTVTIIEKPIQMEMFDDKMLSADNRKEYKILGQVFDTYWILEFRDKLYIVDQHAAHEKVNFERMMKRFKAKELLSQNITPPIILTLTASENEIYLRYREYFEKLGFVIDEFGGNDYAMRAIPMDLYGSNDAKSMFMEVLDELDSSSDHREPDLIYYKIASMACKASVKGGNRMNMAEMEALIDELLTLDNPYNCPHGRPTIISMSKYELEKRFKRVVE
ncbi:DNA mismatch repair endonuclease MutL [Butyrivibrio sp. MC2013]|uniref:DNA mismatch repair endonuclease MutL n=1 Tax=Butyrivibrio sp. MC2013 TaxID=1280686 RepID=UPI00041F1403|nr:DNA mismatch repair endonuclease MutL [Butyrivibrio sp. MC2013]